MSIAIITGASSGLGAEYVKAAAEMFPEIDEYWLIARRRERMEELAALLPQKKFNILAMDLANTDNLAALEASLKGKEPSIGLLINCSGFGIMGDTDSTDFTRQIAMVDVNCRALTAISNMCIPFMAKGSFVLNVASIAAFMPIAGMNVYAATKSYVLSFSKGLRRELKKKGVNVMAICPGPMNTEFFGVAGISVEAIANRSNLLTALPWVNPQKATRRSLKMAKKGRSVYTPRLIYKFYRVLAALVPDSIFMKFLYLK
ncbi:MAG: SDR family NAD(P)-dependent oxidoreductase [Clostridia bacterium]|nr:SDR family NAD(P)-dependent oxidoreductase [Clostridia bacterium]